MPGIEWLDDSGDHDDVRPADRVLPGPVHTDPVHADPVHAGPVPTAGGHRRPDVGASARSWGPVVTTCALWAVAAAGTAYASFGTLYRVHFGGGTLSDATVDGWGRYPKDSTAVAGEHGTRYGIALSVVAAVLVVVAIASLVAVARPRRSAPVLRVARALGLAALGALVGILAAAALEAQGELDSVRAAIRLERLDTADHAASTVSTRLHYGSLLWFGAAAAACAALALLAPTVSSLVTRAVRRRRALVRASVPTAWADHPDDEALTSGPGRRFPPAAG